MKFSVKDVLSECDQIWHLKHLLTKSLMENFIFRAVMTVQRGMGTRFNFQTESGKRFGRTH